MKNSNYKKLNIATEDDLLDIFEKISSAAIVSLRNQGNKISEEKAVALKSKMVELQVLYAILPELHVELEKEYSYSKRKLCGKFKSIKYLYFERFQMFYRTYKESSPVNVLAFNEQVQLSLLSRQYIADFCTVTAINASNFIPKILSVSSFLNKTADLLDTLKIMNSYSYLHGAEIINTAKEVYELNKLWRTDFISLSSTVKNGIVLKDIDLPASYEVMRARISAISDYLIC